MRKRGIALLLAAVLAVSLTACGGGGGEGTGGTAGGVSDGNVGGSTGGNTGGTGTPVTGNADGVYAVFNDGSDPVSPGQPERALDPAAVYGSLTYTPQMFYGSYRLKGGDEALELYRQEMDYSDELAGMANGQMTTKVPYRLEAGPNTLSNMVSHVTEHDWIRAYFQSDRGNMVSLFFAYTIDGNKLSLQALDTFDYDEDNQKITYALSDTVLEYEFAFHGVELTLSRDGKSVTMCTGMAVSEDTSYFYAEAYLSPNSPGLTGIDEISFLYDARDSSLTRFYLVDGDGTITYNAYGTLAENGLFTLTAPQADGSVKTDQYVYFYGYRDGLVLTDGTEFFYYNDSLRMRNQNNLTQYIIEDDSIALDSLSDRELEHLAARTTDLVADLTATFAEAGIQVTVDVNTGEMAMDSSVLFGGDSAELTDAGKELLDRFLTVYTSVIYSDKYDGFIAKTMIEGHTAPVPGGTYENSLPLSVERANRVKEYCMTTGAAAGSSQLAASLEAVGYSNSRPIYNADGTVDMDASRRVSFRFIINLEG